MRDSLACNCVVSDLSGLAGDDCPALGPALPPGFVAVDPDLSRAPQQARKAALAARGDLARDQAWALLVL